MLNQKVQPDSHPDLRPAVQRYPSGPESHQMFIIARSFLKKLCVCVLLCCVCLVWLELWAALLPHPQGFRWHRNIWSVSLQDTRQIREQTVSVCLPGVEQNRAFSLQLCSQDRCVASLMAWSRCHSDACYHSNQSDPLKTHDFDLHTLTHTDHTITIQGVGFFWFFFNPVMRKE